MPMQLLLRLRQAHLPLNITEGEDIQKCEVLCAAKLIEAEIPVYRPEGPAAYLAHAMVTSVRGMAASKGRASMAEGSASYYPRSTKSSMPSSRGMR